MDKNKKKHQLHRADSIEVIDDISEDLDDSDDDSEADERIRKQVLEDGTDTERSKVRIFLWISAIEQYCLHLLYRC